MSPSMMSTVAATTAEKIRRVSSCMIKPAECISEESKKPCYLTPWDLALLSSNYIQKGLLFIKPEQFETATIIDQLKHSLSLTLTHFFPLAGRLATVNEPPTYCVFLDTSNNQGAEFVHAVANLTVSDVLSPTDVPLIVQSFFAHGKVSNHDGDTVPLLSVQVTELVDGIFIGCFCNHVVADGTSFWHFFNSWAEICRALVTNGEELRSISRPPVTKRWFPQEEDMMINLPLSHHNELMDRYEDPPLRDRIFHFSSESVAKLKAKANAECNLKNKISSFQALIALVWRSLTRVRCLPTDQKVWCLFSINNRPRLNPPLSKDYFGNAIQVASGITTAGELLDHSLGWAAMLINEVVSGQTDANAREWLAVWIKNPIIYQLESVSGNSSMMVGSSPKFDMYTCEFGFGQAIAVRSGLDNKFDGKVMCYPGVEGGGSVDVEICLHPDLMSALESDKELLSSVCLPMPLH